MEEVPVKFPGDESTPKKELARRHRHEALRALRLDDTGRRLREAQTFIDEHKEEYEKERKKWEEKYLRSGE